MAESFKNQVREGMEVFDADEEKVGTVAESLEGYMRIPTGILGLGKEHYVPLSAVREVSEDEIYLNVSKDQLDDLESEVTLAKDDDRDFDGTQVERTVTTTTAATTSQHTPARDDDERTLQLREEELTARKQTVETGEVSLSKDVVTEQRTLEVPVTREEVTIERHPIDRRPADQPISNTDESISVPVHEEQVRADKRTVVYEEVGVDKRTVQETERVSDTVRREELAVESEGRVDVDQASTSPSKPA